MGSVSGSADLKCHLCMTSTENEITGVLATKAGIVAHQNCLLYASGIYCKSSPPHDDLFGFDVDDVKAELKRGKKLKCSRCMKGGATAGCEVKKCKRSYHYPCAMVVQAKTVEKRGRYMLYCPKHDPSNDILEWSKNIKNRKLSSGASEAHNSGSAGNDSDASDMENIHPGSKSGFGTPLRGRKRKYTLHSSDDEVPCSIDPIHAPLESDLEDITPPVLHRQSTPDPGDNSFDEEPKPSTSGDAPADSDETCSDLGHDSDSLIPSEYRQENVPVTVFTDSGPSETSPGPISPYSPGPCTLAPCISPLSETDNFNNDPNILLNPSSSAPPSVKEPSTATEQCENPHPVSQHVDPVFKISLDLDTSHHNQLLQTTASAGDSFAPPQATESLGKVDVSDSSAALFWRRCNEEGYTEYIFTELKHQLSDLAERVQNQSATQQDYNISLRILEASERIPTIFEQLTQDLDEQERKLSRKREALRDARAALGHNHVI